MDRDPIGTFESLLRLARFGRYIMDLLNGLRRPDETPEATFHRILLQAKKTMCMPCAVKRRLPSTDGSCGICHGTGETPYDPRTPVIKDVMET